LYNLFTGPSGKALFVLTSEGHTNDISMFVKTYRPTYLQLYSVTLWYS